jgi:hypothetical protein
MWIWGQAPLFRILLVVCMLGCGTPAPQIAGIWSGRMMIDGGGSGPTFVHVAVTFTQDGSRVEGHWRALDGTSDAEGLVSGTVTRENGGQPVNVRFTYTGRHPIRSIGTCVGSARSEGQLTYNTTIDTAGGPSPERPGWGIRLKAFDGFAFESCPAIGYATWTLTRERPMGQ